MKKQKFISIKWFILLAIILILIPVIVNAQAPPAPTVTGQAADVFTNVLDHLVRLLATVLQVLQKILWPLFLAIGGLLNNDLLFGFAMEQRLLEIWSQVRNLVNIGFVLMLLGIALWNVTGFAKEEFQIKKILPKFIIALILVNFSFAGAKIVLDVSNVLTHVVFTLPSSISDEVSSTKIVGNTVQEQKICGALFGNKTDFRVKVSDLKAKMIPGTAVSPAEDPSKFYCELDSSNNYKFTITGRQYFSKYTSRNAALIIAVQMMQIVEADKLSESVKTGGKVKLSDLSFQILFSVVLYVVYGIAYVVLFVVLIARLVYLWVLIALSPIIVVQKVLLPNLKLSDKGDLLKEFIDNAFVPVLIGIPLTIGYVMLMALKNVGKGTAISTDIALQVVRVDNAAISDLQTLVIAIAAVAVVWMGVFAAAEKSIASTTVSNMKGTITDQYRKVKRAARFIPLIPAGKGKGGRMSFEQLRGIWNRPLEKLENKYGQNRDQLTNSKISNIAKGSDVQEAEDAFRRGIGKKHLQKELYLLSQKWSRVTGTTAKARRQRAFARKVQAGLSSTQLKDWERGALGTAGQQRIKTNVGAATTTSGTGTAAGTGARAATPTGGAGVQRRGAIRGHALGIAVPTAHHQAASSGAALTGASPDDKNKYEAVANTNYQLTAVQDKSGEMKGAANVAAVKDKKIKELETTLRTADNALKNQVGYRVGDAGSQAKRKAMLRQIVEKALDAKKTFLSDPRFSSVNAYL